MSKRLSITNITNNNTKHQDDAHTKMT